MLARIDRESGHLFATMEHGMTAFVLHFELVVASLDFAEADMGVCRPPAAIDDEVLFLVVEHRAGDGLFVVERRLEERLQLENAKFAFLVEHSRLEHLTGFLGVGS
jgi:hypothetical protein